MKRKDTKGRVLKNGEYQEANGRYVFKYGSVTTNG